MNLLRQLLADIDDVKLDGDELVAQYKLEKGDDPGDPVRILPDPLKRHYAVLDRARQSLLELYEQLQEKVLEMGPDHADLAATMKASQQELNIASSRYHDIERMFWSAVRRTFPDLMEEKEIGLREGWQVVVIGKLDERCEMCPSRAECDHAGHPSRDGKHALDGMRFMVGRGGVAELLEALAGEPGIHGSAFPDGLEEMIASARRS